MLPGMKISIRVKIRSRNEKIEKSKDGSFSISVKEIPKKGAANLKVIELVSDYFRVSRSRIYIIRGKTSMHKVVEII